MNLYEASTVLETDEPEMVLSLEEYEETKKQIERIIATGDAALRLANHPDFKTLILEGYLTEEPKRIAELMACGRLQQVTLENCTRELDAIGKFRNFMKNMTEQATMARNELIDLEAARDEALAAEAEAVG